MLCVPLGLLSQVPKAVQRLQERAVLLADVPSCSQAHACVNHHHVQSAASLPGVHGCAMKSSAAHLRKAHATVLCCCVPLSPQSSIAVFVMFSSYILHSWAMPFLTRENVPQTFYDIVNAEGATDVRVRVGCGFRWARSVAWECGDRVAVLAGLLVGEAPSPPGFNANCPWSCACCSSTCGSPRSCA